MSTSSVFQPWGTNAPNVIGRLAGMAVFLRLGDDGDGP
jgi:hypothetical protein